MKADVESFLEFLQNSGPAASAREARERLGADRVQSLRRTWSGRLLRTGTSEGQILAELGKPDLRGDGMIGYADSNHPGYFYAFHFDAQGRGLRESGYWLGETRPAPRLNRDLEACKNQLAEMGATAHELRAWLGEPASTYGWWPEETWEYASGLIIDLRHGIVVADE